MLKDKLNSGEAATDATGFSANQQEAPIATLMEQRAGRISMSHHAERRKKSIRDSNQTGDESHASGVRKPHQIKPL